MASNFPRFPVRFLAQNQELLKSQTNLAGAELGATDYDANESTPTAHMEPQFRAPGDRNLGNQLFRRNPDGSLDIEAAKMVVVDIIHKVKDGLALTELEKLAVGCCFPLQFPYVDARLAKQLSAVQLKLTPWEMTLITAAVAEHLSQEMSYNAGNGGFPTPHRRA